MTDDDLLEIYRAAVEEAMTSANEREGFASSASRESLVAGARAVFNAGQTQSLSEQ